MDNRSEIQRQDRPSILASAHRIEPHPRHVVRWYVLVSPSRTRSHTADLQRELAYREHHGEPLFEYFAPSFVEVREVKGQLIDTRQPLLYNYLFVHASESEIYRMKQRLPHYNFLPRINDSKEEYHYPYLTDEAMRDLRWIARSYAGSIPLCTAESAWLTQGDTIRITQGRFKGIEARVVSPPRSRHKEILVRIENWMWVPLLQVHPGEYEIVELCGDGHPIYSHLNNLHIQEGLHEALCRHLRTETTAEDRTLATDALHRYANLAADSVVIRCKLYSLLLQAYTILEEHEKSEALLQVIRILLPAVKAEQSRALLLVTLYGCTDDHRYYDMAHATLAPWMTETNPKKSKMRLIQRLADYDRCLGHTDR